MAAAERSPHGWPECEVGGCGGVRLGGDRRCWGHAADPAVHRALERIGRGGSLDARGVRFTASRLQEVLAAAPRDAEGQPRLVRADFRSCRFAPGTSFAKVRFDGRTRFDEARFEGEANFSEARFGGDAWFGSARFTGEARFAEARFSGETWFVAARFGASGWFPAATFDAAVSFQQASFGDDAQLHGARFAGDLTVTTATVGRDAVLSDAGFEAATVFAGTRIGGVANFTRAAFATARQLGPLLAADRLLLGETVWQSRARIQVVTARVESPRARFVDGVHLEVRRGGAPGAVLELDGADFAAPSIVGHGAPFPGLPEPASTTPTGEPAEPGQPGHPGDPGDPGEPGKRGRHGPDRGDEADLPQVLSLRGADVAGLTLSRVDLGRCLFDGAHNLDRLRTDAVRFAAPPRWRTHRDVIAEERHWRAANALGRRSRERWARALVPGPGGAPAPLRADQVAALYRGLRRGREGLKDQPGAADLYYGEMELRRQATSPRHRPGEQAARRSRAAVAGEHAILALYWLASGYGLRAWRALAALSVLVVAAGLALAAWGLRDPVPAGGRASPADALLIGARAATAVLAGPDARLTTFGEWLQIALRLVGPALLGLALLALRGRVKR